ncbi:MAG: sigma factor-like helix-turn-helix DNA-binding protein [Verrucomicrobiota bacterium]
MPKTTEEQTGADYPLQQNESQSVQQCLVVPERIQHLSTTELPRSVRLEGALDKLGVTKLGDLNGVPVSRLRNGGNCGQVTINELFKLIERANAGEFELSESEKKQFKFATLARFTDELVKVIDKRDRVIFLRRFGGNTEPAQTLESIGTRFHVTRERIRQIETKILILLSSEGGPKLKFYLERVVAYCCEEVYPLTPERVARWAKEQKYALQYHPSFYVRLYADLWPDLPAWPDGQKVGYSHAPRLDAVAKCLEDKLREQNTSLTLKKALAMLQAPGGYPQVTTVEFLQALGRSPWLPVQFDDGKNPKVSAA